MRHNNILKVTDKIWRNFHPLDQLYFSWSHDISYSGEVTRTISYTRNGRGFLDISVILCTFAILSVSDFEFLIKEVPRLLLSRVGTFVIVVRIGQPYWWLPYRFGTNMISVAWSHFFAIFNLNSSHIFFLQIWHQFHEEFFFLLGPFFSAFFSQKVALFLRSHCHLARLRYQRHSRSKDVVISN